VRGQLRLDLVRTDHRRTNKEKRGRERVFLVNEESLRKNPNDRKLERRCAALAIELERPNDARRHLIHLNDAIQADPDKATEAAELEDLLGQCDQPESKFDEAERHYRKSIALDSTRVVTFDRLARLLRQDMKNPEAADRAIEEMLKANPKSALAYVRKWRYHREFGPAADGNNIALALKFGPDEAEVLIAATELARQSKDPVGARKHIEQGLDRHPESVPFYQRRGPRTGREPRRPRRGCPPPRDRRGPLERPAQDAAGGDPDQREQT
jgi:tetratricopeptide (TPR) repeat protein